MLTVVTPATQTRLTTVSAVRDALDLDEEDFSDEKIESFIDQASQAIVDYCGRPFGRETYLETFRKVDCRSDGLLLSRAPVVSITSIDSDGTSVVLPEYEIENGALYRLSNNSRYAWRAAVLAVTYVAGYILPSDEVGAPAATLPLTVQRAAIDEIAAYVSYEDRDALIKSETVEGVGSTSYYVPGESSILESPGSQAVLSKYRSAAWSVG
jgi:hypothetical protein